MTAPRRKPSTTAQLRVRIEALEKDKAEFLKSVEALVISNRTQKQQIEQLDGRITALALPLVHWHRKRWWQIWK